jgi:CRISPR/Cas system CMR-associated protein Cmr1 (group 7 of RAMP superfamily)
MNTTLCIPRIKTKTNKRFIESTLNKCKFGKINSIVERPVYNNKDYKTITIRLQIDPTTENGENLTLNLQNGQSTKIVYDKYEFWRMVIAH